jgi:hypothetical protein
MKSLASILSGIALFAALLTAGPVVPAQEEDAAGDGRKNIMLTFRIGKFEDGKMEQVKAYELVVADGTRGSSLLSGARVPFPAAEGEGEIQPFVYHNVGFSTTVEAEIFGDDRILLRAELEDSRIREGEEGDPPVVETRQLRINVVLTNGVPLTLTRVKGLSDVPGYVEVEAIIID